MKKLQTILYALVASSVMAWSLPASAGIIVTVGKLPTAADGEVKTGDVRRATVGAEGATTSTTSTTSAAPTVPNVPGTAPVPKSGPRAPLAPGGDSVADASPPSKQTSGTAAGSDGYDPTQCVPIGGGLVYCDEDDTHGAGPGADEGGELDAADLDDQTGEVGGDEIEVLGCGAGGTAAPLGWALLGLFGFALTRRRRA